MADEPMTLQKQVTFWLVTLAVFILILWLLRGMLLPFVAGMALAYFLDPVADRLERLGLGRLPATLLIVGVFLLGFVLSVILLAPLLTSQLIAFIQGVPDYVMSLQNLLTSENRQWLTPMLGNWLPDVQKSLSELVTQGARWLLASLQGLWSGGTALISVVSLIVVTPIVAFYLLYDWERMISAIDSWLPLKHRDTIRELAREMNMAIAGFVRGQAGVCLILASYYALGLILVGLNFGLLIGSMAGLFSFIPYVGSLAGFLTATGVAFVQFWPDWHWVLAVMAVFAIGQILEGYILAPNLVGHSVGLHPVWLMFALFAFGYLFGFVGLLLAVPLAAATGVLTRFALRRYLASPFYTGVPRPGPDAE
jgi:predicted PurR-regulated permease PerM